MNDGTAAGSVQLSRVPGSKPGVAVLKVAGPLTIRNFFEFQDETRRQDAPVLLVDLSDVPYMDSAALGSLLGLHVSCARTNRKYGLVKPSDRLRTMFTVAGVADLLATFSSIADAEAALA